MIKRFFLLFTLPALALAAPPSPVVELLSREALQQDAAGATPERFPNADTVLVDEWTKARYESDGTAVVREDSAIKILTEKGLRENRTLSFHYTKPYSEMQVQLIEVLRPDGTALTVDLETHSRDMAEPGQMSQNIYNPNRRILQVTVPELEIGDTLRYIYERRLVKPRVPNTWSDYRVFESTSPIMKIRYDVDAPASMPLVRIALKGEPAGTLEDSVEEKGDRIHYRWEARDVPRMFPEPKMPAQYTVVRRLLVSTIDNWPEVSRWYWELSLPHLEDETEEMHEMVADLTRDVEDPMEKIRRIFKFVSQDIRYMGITIETEAPGYEPHDVSLTFNNRYGVCRDKAALLVTLLRIADIEAFPVLIKAGPKMDEEVPVPYFNHAITAARVNGEYVLMDSTDENTKDLLPAYLSNMSYLPATPDGEDLLTSPIIPAEKNLLHIETEGGITEQGSLEAHSRLLFEGVNDTSYRGYLSRIRPEERSQFLERLLKRGIPGARLNGHRITPEDIRDTTRPLEIELIYALEGLLVEGEEVQLMQLPSLARVFGIANFIIGETGLQERKYPLRNAIACGVEERQELELPSSLGTIKSMPQFQPLDTPKVGWNRSVEKEEALLRSSSSFQIRDVEFSPEEYLELKSNLKDIEVDLRRQVVLEKQQSGEVSDQEILSHRIHYQLQDARNWTATEKVKKKINSYAGKKAASEVKIHYNPAWDEVEIVRAVVTDSEGQTSEITDKEINIMDARWVGSAPRYPAAKILIASLPGVEVGSIIEYEIRTTRTDRPFFSTRQYLDDFHPVHERTVSVTAPAGLDIRVNTLNMPEDVLEMSEANGMVRFSGLTAVTSSESAGAPKRTGPAPGMALPPRHADVINPRLECACQRAPAGAVRSRSKPARRPFAGRKADRRQKRLDAGHARNPG